MSLDTTAVNNDAFLSPSTHGTTPVTPTDSKHELLHEHPRFFYDDGNVEFQVENTLYKLHRFFFSHYSPWFRTRFSQPESESVQSDGPLPPGWECIDGPDGIQAFVNYAQRKTTFEPPSPVWRDDVDSDVILLEGVKTEEFDALCSIFYPEDLDLGDLSTPHEWTSVLRLSTLYSFTTLSSRACRELSPLISPLERLILARQYDYESWVDEALRGLIMREESLKAEEMRRMGYEDIAFVAAVREEIRGGVVGNEERVKARVEEYLARRRYESESSSSGRIEESSTSRSSSDMGGEEVDRTEIGEGDDVHVKMESLDEEHGVFGVTLVAQKTGGGPSREREEPGEDSDDKAALEVPEEASNCEPEPMSEQTEHSAEPASEVPAEPVQEPNPTEPTQRSTISPIPEQEHEDESRTSNASPADEEPAPFSVSPELIPIPLEYVPLPSFVRSGTPSSEDVTRPESAAAIPSGEDEQLAPAPSSESASHPADEGVRDATQDVAPVPAPIQQEVLKPTTPPPTVAEAPKRATSPPADEEPTPVPVPEQDPHAKTEEEKKRREEDEAKAREDAIWAEFERETKLRDETAKALAEEREKANATPPPARPSLWGALARSPSTSVTETSATAATASSVPRQSPSRSSSMTLSFSGAAPGAPSLWSRFSYLSAKPPSRSSSPARRGSVSSVTAPIHVYGSGSRSSSLARADSVGVGVGSPPNTADLHDALQDRAVVAGI